MPGAPNPAHHFDQLILYIFQNLITLIVQTILGLSLELLQIENHTLQLRLSFLSLCIGQMRKIFFQGLLKGVHLLPPGLDFLLLRFYLFVEADRTGLRLRQFAQSAVEIHKADLQRVCPRHRRS